MANIYFTASFGDIPLLISSIETEHGRDISVASPAHGDKHTLNDHGLRQRRTTCELLFADRPGWPPYLDRLDQLIGMFNSGQVALFNHPIDGQYRARVTDVSQRHESDELAVRVSCVFLAEDPPKAVFAVGAGVSLVASPEAVMVAAALVDEELADRGLSSDVPTQIVTTITSWSGLDLEAQRVYLEVATLSDRIDTTIVDLQLTTDLSRWPAYEAMIRLRHSLRNAAEAYTSATRNVFDLFVETPQPLIRICTEIYGAELAVERADQVTHLNRLRTPSLVPRGTTLKMPAVGA